MQTRVREILAHKGRAVHTVSPSARVIDAVYLMNEAGIGSVLVFNDDEVVGILSERDILTRLVVPERSASKTRVGDIMTTDVITIWPNATVAEAMKLVTRARVRHLPVMVGKTLHGIISIGDLTKAMTDDLQDEVHHLEDFITGRV